MPADLQTSQPHTSPEVVNIAPTHLYMVLSLSTVRFVSERYCRKVKSEQAARRLRDVWISIIPTGVKKAYLSKMLTDELGSHKKETS